MASIKVGGFTCKLFWQIQITQLEHSSNFKSSVNIKHIYAPFNFAISFSLQNVRNNGHAITKGFMVFVD